MDAALFVLKLKPNYMKAFVNSELTSSSFPRLMKWLDEAVVLVTAVDDNLATGIMLLPAGTGYKIGDNMSGDYKMDVIDLSNFNGTITLQND